ncbi:ATP-dependent DNA helicase [Mycobacterium sp. D16R24]|uniref:ATP-dependent helicase n=1 Tax=Mycobacterium sp. D16R24 TaxID=1855656 RepID=UPI0009922902|nr:ATP-dependent DNA helicase [Mycobacterium sp. D16R24]
MPTPTASTRSWDGAAADLLAPDRQGRFVVVGGSGTGKTSLLVDIVAARIAAGASPESVLVLTGSARASVELRSRISAAVFERNGSIAIREPMVRTVHSYAFAVLAAHAARQGNPPPRLITAAEQDSIVRELLCGNAEDNSGSWPASLRPALTTAGFATDVRDLMARCTERGVDAKELRAIGRRHNRPEWVAVADLARQYEEVMLLRSAVGMAAPQATVPALGAAELVGSALETFAVEPAILAAERARIGLLLVDDSQHLDPQAALMVRLLAGGASLSVFTGDPNQTVFGFRGADAQLLQTGTDGGDTTIALDSSYRCAAPVAELANAVAGRLPGSSPARTIAGPENSLAAVRLAAVPTETAEASLVVDLLRRSHLTDGVPWSQMAVIVRSVPRSGAALRRALQSAGVPVHAESYDGPVAAVPAVHALLLAVCAAQGRLNDEDAVTLVTGPIGRVDPVALRRLRRQLLRAEEARGTGGNSAELLRAVLVDADDTQLAALTDIQAAPLRRVRAVIASARESVASGASVLDVLWAAWTRSGLQRRWDGLSQRGGPLGAQADRDLDAVSALFDLASEHVARTPGIGVMGLIDHIRSLALAGQRSTGEPDAVSIVSAHAAVGRQWDVVAIPGVQEGLWPNTAVRGGVLRTQELMDVLAGIDHVAHVDGSAVALAEERRLLLLAVGRAARRVLVTAVDNENADIGGGPAMASRFLAELMGAHPEWVMPDRRPGTPESRALTVANLVGELRAVVTASACTVSEGRRRAAAARQLARLADAGVPGADPESWYGLADISSEDPLWHAEDGPVRLSPSNVETLMACPLRWLLERHGGTDLTDPRRALGTLVHALVGEHSADAETMRRELDKAWESLPFESRWYARNELQRQHELLEAFTTWRVATRGELTEVGREIGVDGMLTHAGHPQVRLVGRIDRLERDAEGRAVVIDIKTGKSPATKDDAQQHAQLATYQVAAAEGLIVGQPAGEPGGGRLVYVAKPNLDDGATQRYQDSLTPAAQETWRETIHTAAANTQGPMFIARVNDGCGHCPLRACCPAQADGQAVCQS